MSGYKGVEIQELEKDDDTIIKDAETIIKTGEFISLNDAKNNLNVMCVIAEPFNISAMCRKCNLRSKCEMLFLQAVNCNSVGSPDFTVDCCYYCFKKTYCNYMEFRKLCMEISGRLRDDILIK